MDAYEVHSDGNAKSRKALTGERELPTGTSPTRDAPPRSSVVKPKEPFHRSKRVRRPFCRHQAIGGGSQVTIIETNINNNDTTTVITRHARYSRHHGAGESKEAEHKTPRAPPPEAGTATLIRGEEKVSAPDATLLRHIRLSDPCHVPEKTYHRSRTAEPSTTATTTTTSPSPSSQQQQSR